ncbi:MAG: alpha/beta hydrolase [Kofleriaceae bacterium]
MRHPVHYRRSNGIAYREAGRAGAPVVVLLHGFPTSSHMFRDLIPLLAVRYHVIAPDYPGFGYSDAPDPRVFEYTFDHLADVIDRFLEALKLGTYALYLQDFGGPVGFRIAARHPERVTGLVIQNANMYEEGLGEPLHRIVLPAREAELRQLFERPATLSQYFDGERDPSLVSPDAYEHAQWGMDRPGNKAIQLALHADYRNNIPRYPEWQAYLRERQPPMLITWGANDNVFPAAGARAYLRDVPRAELVLLDAGHFALETQLDAIADHVLAFLSRTA